MFRLLFIVALIWETQAFAFLDSGSPTDYRAFQTHSNLTSPSCLMTWLGRAIENAPLTKTGMATTSIPADQLSRIRIENLKSVTSWLTAEGFRKRVFDNGWSHTNSEKERQLLADLRDAEKKMLEATSMISVSEYYVISNDLKSIIAESEKELLRLQQQRTNALAREKPNDTIIEILARNIEGARHRLSSARHNLSRLGTTAFLDSVVRKEREEAAEQLVSARSAILWYLSESQAGQPAIFHNVRIVGQRMIIGSTADDVIVFDGLSLTPVYYRAIVPG